MQAALGIRFNKNREKLVYEKPPAPASIGGVLDDGLRLWRTSLSRTWGLALLAQAIAAIPAIFFAPPAVVPAANAGLNERLMLIMGQSSRYLFSFFFFLAISYIFRNAVIARVNSIAINAELSFGQSLSKGLRLTPRTLGMGLLVGLAFSVFMLVVRIHRRLGRGHVGQSLGADPGWCWALAACLLRYSPYTRPSS